ncbi:hypothetical protein B4N84_06220 [Flavobacterium sp. IR1]|nr:hypothetical protein B4N84_06220 [Flavobacterium sp. IR1]
MKKLYFLTALFLLLTSCSSDNDSGTEEQLENVLPAVTTQTFGNFNIKLTTNNTFDGNKILSRKDEETQTLFTYEGSHIIKQEVWSKNVYGSETQTLENLYSYENGKLKTKISKQVFMALDGVTISTFKTQYIHTSDTLVSFTNYLINVKTKEEVKIGSGFLKYKNGNIVEEQAISGAVKTVRTFEYDKKNNPFKNVLGFNLLQDPFNNYGKNNIIKSTTTSIHSAPLIFSRTYIYNDKGYPIKCSSFYDDSKSIDFEMEYTY